MGPRTAQHATYLLVLFVDAATEAQRELAGAAGLSHRGRGDEPRRLRVMLLSLVLLLRLLLMILLLLLLLFVLLLMLLLLTPFLSWRHDCIVG